MRNILAVFRPSFERVNILSHQPWELVMDFDTLVELLKPQTEHQVELVRLAASAGVTVVFSNPRFRVEVPGAGVVTVLGRDIVFRILSTALQPA
jgi:hypothetical protein